MAITQIKVDGEIVEDLTTPVKIHLHGSGKHKILYLTDTDTIKQEAFKDCDIEKITIPATIKNIQLDAFKDSKITNVVLQGTEAKSLAENVIPQEAILTVSHETVGYYNNAIIAESKTSDFISDIPVGCVLYEKLDGTLYTSVYDKTITDTPIGVCVIPKGLYDEHAHFIGLVNIAYDAEGNVITVTDNYNQWCIWNPYIAHYQYWWQEGIECYSLIPYCGLLYHAGEKDGRVIYNTLDDMPDLLHTDKSSGNMYYTETVEFDFKYDLLGALDLSDKSHSLSVDCCVDGSNPTRLPGGVLMNNPYYRNSKYSYDTIMPCLTYASSSAPYFYTRHHYLPSPYLQVSASDEVVANPVLLKVLPGSPNLSGDKGNPFTFIGSANEFLIPNILSKCTKPTPETVDAMDRGEPFKYGTTNNGTEGTIPTFFPAPYCCYEFAPGTGNTKHQWALGTPLEWACTFAKIGKIESTLESLKVKGYTVHNLTTLNGAMFWGGLMANDGMCFLMDGFTKSITDMVGCTLPRLQTRPFIVI